MKATVIEYLTVRAGQPSLKAPTYQYLAPGSEIVVDGQLHKGDAFKGIDTWLKDEVGNYYWSGAMKYEEGITQQQQQQQQIQQQASHFVSKVAWFESLKIDEIWETYKSRGENVKVAVLDTGYNTAFAELKASVLSEKVLFTAGKYPGVKSAIGDQSNDGHGTRCASIIAGNSGLLPLAGIAPACKLLIGKISINKELRDFGFIFSGIQWAIEQGADIISVSFAQKLPPAEIAQYQPKLKALLSDNNVLLFAASGNSGQPQETQDLYPACFEGCVSVGAVDVANQLSAITVLNSRTFIHAPGVDIEAFIDGSPPTKSSGTSFATPIVSGVAALAASYLKLKNGGQWNSRELAEKMIRFGAPLKNFPERKVIDLLTLFKNL